MATSLMTTPEACAFLGGLHYATLARWRMEGTGPTFRKVGGKVFYMKRDLEKYLTEARRTSTSDPGPGAL